MVGRRCPTREVGSFECREDLRQMPNAKKKYQSVPETARRAHGNSKIYMCSASGVRSSILQRGTLMGVESTTPTEPARNTARVWHSKYTPRARSLCGDGGGGDDTEPPPIPKAAGGSLRGGRRAGQQTRARCASQHRRAWVGTAEPPGISGPGCRRARPAPTWAARPSPRRDPGRDSGGGGGGESGELDGSCGRGRRGVR